MDAFNYQGFFRSIKNRVLQARINFSRQANREANSLYWFIGEMIVKNQEKQGWGRSVVENLSRDLKASFPDIKFGFSERNLWNMRQFYLAYDGNEKLQQLAAEIAWMSNILIINKIKDIKAREYYLRATIEMGWTRNILGLQIGSQAYERQCLEGKTHNFQQAMTKHLADQADKSLKSVYSLEMLGIAKPVVENELRRRMVMQIKDVLLEFGHGFTFVGEEYRLVSPSGAESFIDLLFYNRKLQCLTALELKSGVFKPEYAGKMNYYLGLLDDFVRESWENHSMGIILCKDKDRVNVEYSLKDINKPIGVAGYKLSKDLPKEIADKLPDPKQLEAEILRKMDFSDE